jgi:hypothetical protein
MHEEGHGIFGLIDTYCAINVTFYGQASPYPNLWGSLDNCTRDISSQGWPSSKGSCRMLNISEEVPGDYIHCSLPWYHFDLTDPLNIDIMMTANPPFGVASTRRINYVLNEYFVAGH